MVFKKLIWWVCTECKTPFKDTDANSDHHMQCDCGKKCVRIEDLFAELNELKVENTKIKDVLSSVKLAVEVLKALLSRLELKLGVERSNELLKEIDFLTKYQGGYL